MESGTLAALVSVSLALYFGRKFAYSNWPGKRVEKLILLLPYLIPNFWTATTVSIIVVMLELAVISWIRHRYMDTPILSATFQVMVGGALVFIAGILIGSS